VGVRKEFIALSFATALILLPPALNAAAAPKTPSTGSTVSGVLSNASVAATTTVPVEAPHPAAPAASHDRTRAEMSPVSLSIPSIGLNDPIQKMGVLKNGELAVPSGSTNNVGWYAAGTLPGQIGSAVLDAHVFAAFKNLHSLSAGDDIYVTDADGTVLHFKVETTEVFKLGNLSANYLFSRTDAKRLTLITCAGQLTPDHSTYTHRLVVSAVLVD
jgi:LPXTG-site transpeptidase (sortase) family protein